VRGRGILAALACFALAPALAVPVRAQAADAPTLRTHRVTASGGLTWSGGYPAGDATAILRTNSIGIPAPFTLFAASSDVESAAGAEGRVGFTLTPSFAIEGGVAFAQPRISVSISGDPETLAQVLAGEQVQQYVFDGGVVWQAPIRLGPRMRPFLTGGAGYVRQLHEERTLVESGTIIYAGTGIRYWLAGGNGRSRSFGLRGDVRLNVRRGGIDFENKTRTYPTAGIGIFVGL
jgi:hypothetical protein